MALTDGTAVRVAVAIGMPIAGISGSVGAASGLLGSSVRMRHTSGGEGAFNDRRRITLHVYGGA